MENRKHFDVIASHLLLVGERRARRAGQWDRAARLHPAPGGPGACSRNSLFLACFLLQMQCNGLVTNWPKNSPLQEPFLTTYLQAAPFTANQSRCAYILRVLS